MRKTNIIKRSIIFALVLTIVTSMSNGVVLAAESDEVVATTNKTDVQEIDETSNNLDPQTIVMFDQDGNISGYQKMEGRTNLDTKSNVENNSLIVSSGKMNIAKDDGISLYANTQMGKVSTSIIGQQPYRNTCFIFAVYPNGKAEGSTGTLVGKNVVLASAHAIYKPEWGGMATSITVQPGFYHDSQGQHSLYGAAQSTNIWMASGYQNNLLAEYDWSLITLNRDYTYFQPYGYAPNYSALVDRTVRGIGYQKEQVSPEMWNMFTGTGKITEASDKMIEFSITLTSGNSGGPIIDEATGAVIGVISQTKTLGPFVTAEQGVRIDEWLYNIIQQCVASNQ